MTVKDVAIRLGIAQRTAATLVREPGFPAIKIGKRWKIDERLYEEWYRRNCGRSFLGPEPPKAKRKNNGVKVWMPDYSLLSDYDRALKLYQAKAAKISNAR